MTKASCCQCYGSFELIPPADDYIKRIYECDGDRHSNTIYWKKDEPIFVSGSYATTSKEELDTGCRFRTTRYG
jgi:hypothetical protein